MKCVIFIEKIAFVPYFITSIALMLNCSFPTPFHQLISGLNMSATVLPG